MFSGAAPHHPDAVKTRNATPTVNALFMVLSQLIYPSARYGSAFDNHRLGRFTALTTTAFFNVLVALDPDVLDRAARTWAAQHGRAAEPIAIDGECIRGAARQDPDGKHHLVAAVEHRSENVLGREAAAHKSDEIPIVRTLATRLDLQGRILTVDAMHVQNETARCLVE